MKILGKTEHTDSYIVELNAKEYGILSELARTAGEWSPLKSQSEVDLSNLLHIILTYSDHRHRLQQVIDTAQQLLEYLDDTPKDDL